jgi:hypothetical protein
MSVYSRRKALAFILAVALSVVFVSIPAAADETETFKALISLDRVPDGIEFGSLNDRGPDGLGIDPYVNSDASKMGNIRITAEAGIGFSSGKAFKYAVTDDNIPDGVWNVMNINVTHFPRAEVNMRGAEYFWFWIDISNWGSGMFPQLLIEEIGSDRDGDLTGLSIHWVPKAGAPIYFEDGEGGWREEIMDKHSDGTPLTSRDSMVPVPFGYKGWVKLPLSSMIETAWGMESLTGKLEAVSVKVISLGMGYYPQNADGYIVIDGLGFSGRNMTGGRSVPYPSDGTWEPDPSDPSDPPEPSAQPPDPTPGQSSEQPAEPSPGQPAESPPSVTPDEEPGGLHPAMIAVIAAAAAVLLGGGFLLIRRKRGSKQS